MTKKSKREVLMVFIVNCVSFLGIYTLVRAVLHTLDHLSPKYPYPHSNIFLIRAAPDPHTITENQHWSLYRSPTLR